MSRWHVTRIGRRLWDYENEADVHDTEKQGMERDGSFDVHAEKPAVGC
jgi:hypothetical protein